MPLSALRISENLELYYNKKHQNRENLSVSEVSSLSKGWETELYSFKLTYEEENNRKEENLIIRIYPGRNAHIKTKSEYDAIVALHNAGYTVPKTHIIEIDESILGKPFIIMDRIIGEEMGDDFNKALEVNDQNKIFKEILPNLCKLFVELHKLDWKIIPNEIENVGELSPYFFVDRSLKRDEK